MEFTFLFYFQNHSDKELRWRAGDVRPSHLRLMTSPAALLYANECPQLINGVAGHISSKQGGCLKRN